MSRHIPDNRPYTDEEREYLSTRPSGEHLLAVNDRRFAHLSDEDREKLIVRSTSDAAKEEYIRSLFEKQDQEDEEASYHPDDVAQVQSLTIAKLKERLEAEGQRINILAEDRDPDDDGDDPLTEKQVLAYRLLNWLDDKRKATIVPKDFDEAQEQKQNDSDGKTEDQGQDKSTDDSEDDDKKE